MIEDAVFGLFFGVDGESFNPWVKLLALKGGALAGSVPVKYWIKIDAHRLTPVVLC